MLREMRSRVVEGRRRGESGYGAGHLFDTLDMELASYITKAKGGSGSRSRW
jgi:hypothetical protein